MKKFHVILGVLAMAVAANGTTEGDIDGDQDVDFADFSALAASFTGTLTAPASDTPGQEGDVHLEINLETGGIMTLQPNNANLAGYSIRTPDSQLVLDADGTPGDWRLPCGGSLFFLPTCFFPGEVTVGRVGMTMMLTEDLVLWNITFAGDADQARNVVFQYTRAGEVTPVDGVVHVIPEPGSLILLAAGGLLVMPRQRCSA